MEDGPDKTKTFKWGEMFLITKSSVIENEKITWEFIDSNRPIKSLNMTYELTNHEGKTRVKFKYEDFDEKSDFFANQNFSSAKYLESIRQFCHTLKGKAFNSDSYRS